MAANQPFLFSRKLAPFFSLNFFEIERKINICVLANYRTLRWPPPKFSIILVSIFDRIETCRSHKNNFISRKIFQKKKKKEDASIAICDGYFSCFLIRYIYENSRPKNGLFQPLEVPGEGTRSRHVGGENRGHTQVKKHAHPSASGRGLWAERDENRGQNTPSQWGRLLRFLPQPFSISGRRAKLFGPLLSSSFAGLRGRIAKPKSPSEWTEILKNKKSKIFFGKIFSFLIGFWWN